MVAFSKAIAGYHIGMGSGENSKTKVDFPGTYAEVGILGPQMVCDVVDPFQSTNNAGRQEEVRV